MPFLYETHMHTCLASACGKSTGKEHARFYKEAGYAGIIMTDHFFGGNTAVPRDLPWEERIRLYWRGYEDAKEEGDRIGLDVFFGIEQNYAGDEYLIYGLTKEYMLAHPEMEHWTRRQQLDDARAYRMGKELGLVMTAGSDNHRSPLPAPYGVELEKRLTSIQDYVRIIISKDQIGLHVPEERFRLPTDGEPDERHVAYTLDAGERDTVSPKQWMGND